MTNACNVLSRYWSGGNTPVPVPVDLVAIATKAGVQVLTDTTIQVGYCGQVSMENSKPVIRYDLPESDVRQRFTVAHELGHYFLGHLDGARSNLVYRDGPAQFSASVFHPKETAANRFAAELLIPMDALDNFIMERKIVDGYALAVLFKVSTIAVDIRVKEWQRIRSRVRAWCP